MKTAPKTIDYLSESAKNHFDKVCSLLDDLEIDYEKEMVRIQSEMKEIMMQEKKSQQMLEEAFRGIGYGID